MSDTGSLLVTYPRFRRAKQLENFEHSPVEKTYISDGARGILS